MYPVPFLRRFGRQCRPRLNGVASRLSREQLLEALINPSARLAPGFGTVTLTLKNGKTVSGILKDETNTEITVKVGDQPKTVIRKDQIAKRTQFSLQHARNEISAHQTRNPGCS